MSDSTNLPPVLTRGTEQVLPSAESLAELMEEKKIRLYLGIDPTGSQLTLGHSVVLKKIQQFADLGHDVILLIGNGTVKVGDPTGKDSTRPELTDEEINENFKNWKEQASKVLDFSKITIMHNGDWLDKLTMPEIIKLMAKTTVQQLMERDMFQERVKNERPIHGHELMYPLLQGYDSVEMDVDLEIGGSDQLFNMMMGRHLQKIYNNREKWVLTTPIINGTDGRKMSKSYGNFIALTEKPNNMYGKLMSVADEELITYFTVLTDIPESEIDEMKQKMKAGENPMEFKKLLAHTITSEYHSKELADKAAEHFHSTVQNKELPDYMPEVQVESEATALEILKLCMPEESNSNIRRLIDQGAIKTFPGEHKIENEEQIIDSDEVEVIKVGKRRFFALQKM